MARYGKVSKLNPEQVLEKALAFFGPDGLGLESQDDNPGCLRLQGGGGFVAVSTCSKDQGCEVELETQEWDWQVQEFMGRI